MKKRTTKPSQVSQVTEIVCHMCGAKVNQGGVNVGQCSNPKCKAEHTVINPLPDDSLTDCQYKDFYG